ncbi:UDP-sulfoquinovose synthase [Tardisphaera saccharovorans]
MKVMVLGVDGYLGWPLALRMIARGHEVCGADNFYTRKAVEEVGSWSAIPIPTMEERVKAVKRVFGADFDFREGDLRDYNFISSFIEEEKPDAIIDFAEQRSAPYSQIDLNHAVFTMENNVIGTMNLLYAMKESAPSAHLLKMGTLGEYGTPNIDIGEGYFEVEYHGRKDRLPFPRQAGSWYHWSKVHDSNNISFAVKIWGLTATDVHQGPVYGTRTEDMKDDELRTRFDFDEVWGTVLNRYCVEAVAGLPLTPYGEGGQTRGFISLEDSITALSVLLEHPPEQGTMRVVNQYAESRSVMELANMVKKAGDEMGLNVQIKPVPDPRVEAQRHYYNVERYVLPSLGFRPSHTVEGEIPVMLRDLMKYRDRLVEKRDAILLAGSNAGVNWRQTSNKVVKKPLRSDLKA